MKILFHADLDGQFAPPCRQPAAAVRDFAGLLAGIDLRRADARDAGEPPPVVLLGGNWSGPDPLANQILASGLAGARTIAALLARAHYDAIALGHVELSLAPPLLDELLPALARAGLPLVATNLTCDARRPACAAIKREILVRRSNALVGVLAVISPSVIAGIAPGRLAGLGLSEPLAAIRDGVKRLRAAGASRVVVLTDGPRDARALGEIDALQRHLDETSAPDAAAGGGPLRRRHRPNGGPVASIAGSAGGRLGGRRGRAHRGRALH